MSVIFAKTKLDNASITVIRAPAATLTSPLIGCSPIDVAMPTVEKCEIAVTATSASGV